MERFAQVYRSVSMLAQVPEAQLKQFFDTGKAVTLAADEPFIRLGETAHRIGFVHRGLVRYSVLTDDGDDITKDFGMAGYFTVSFGSAVVGEPARVAVTAVEETELTVWSWAAMRAWLERDPAWERFARRVAEFLYVRKERRELAFLTQSATERYAEASATFGPLLVRIPQYHLASYLGIAPESLSRLRGRAKKKASADSSRQPRRRKS